MEKYVLCFIAGIFLYSFCIICWHKLLRKKIDFKNYKFYLALLIIDVLSTIINFHVPQFMRFFSTLLVLFATNYYLFCRNFTKCLLTVLLSEFIAFFGEFLIVIIITIFIGDAIYSFTESDIGIFLIFSLVGIIGLIILKFKFIFKLYNYLVKTFNNMKKSNLIIYFILTLVLISLFLITTHMHLPTTFVVICNTLLTIFYLIMLFRLANARENYKSINNKYETSLTSLREYEEIMDKYRVSNHENKNQLLTIRNMIDKKDKKTADYIDKLVDNKIKDNETIFYKTSKIPEGGLRAIIYSKVCKMKDEKITYDLQIANDVKTANLLEIGDGTNLNICKIIGVFLDNAIEASKETNKPKIIIEIYTMDEKLCIDTSNNYKGKIELNKLGTKKYTTKGKGHGYGLKLVNDIIKEDENLNHETRITKEMFTQSLKIKM